MYVFVVRLLSNVKLAHRGLIDYFIKMNKMSNKIL